MTHLCVFQERAGDLEELIAAEFARLREFLQEEEARVKEKLQKQKEEKLNQLEEALTQTTEQISRLENTAEQLRLKLREEENPEQLKVRGRGRTQRAQRHASGVFTHPLHVLCYRESKISSGGE